MAGVHVATSLALISLALSCLNFGNHSQSRLSWIFFLCAFVLCVAAVAVVTHARGRGPKWLGALLDDWIGPPPQRATFLPDMTLIEVVRRICPDDVMLDSDGSVTLSSRHQPISDALRALRESARLTQLVVWGRKDPTAGHEEATPLSLIAPDYWDNYQIAYLRFLTDQRGATEKVKQAPADPRYSDLRFNRRQVNVVWPEPGVRLRVQKPWYFAS
jgi:hypothetical protein